MPANENILFVFPGQGSQYRGMGADLYQDYAVAKKVYDRAGEVLGYDIADLSFNDPEEKIDQTRYTQPVLLTHSVACLEVFRELTGDRLQPAIAGGHSLGEYSALVAAGVLSFENALKLVQQRAELMSAHGEGEMSAFPLDLDSLRPISDRFHCGIAACNLPEQTVIGGRSEDLELVEQTVREEFRRKRPTRLKTEGAFHTYYMIKAAQHYRPVLAAAQYEPSDVRVLSNYTGQYHSGDPVDIQSRLFFQLFHPVMWYANLKTAFDDGVQLVIEFGGGIGPAESKRPNLQGMIRKVLTVSGHEADYLPAINAQTLSETAEAL